MILPGFNFPNMSVRKELETSLTISSANFIAFVPYQIFKRIHLTLFSNFTVQLLLLSIAHLFRITKITKNRFRPKLCQDN